MIGFYIGQILPCISPSRYIHTGEGEEYRPLAEIVEELDELEVEIVETNSRLRVILNQLVL